MHAQQDHQLQNSQVNGGQGHYEEPPIVSFFWNEISDLIDQVEYQDDEVPAHRRELKALTDQNPQPAAQQLQIAGFVPENNIAPLLPLARPKPGQKDRGRYVPSENMCMLQTQTNKKFKEYEISIEPQHVVFSRPQSGRQQKEFRYQLKTFRCAVIPKRLSKQTSKLAKHALVLAVSPTAKGSIFFASRSMLKLWHTKILDAQGFFDQPYSLQYKRSQLLGKGGFGEVFLVKHAYSGEIFAIKKISREKVNEVFVINGQVFAELEIMAKVCRGQSPFLVPLIETFTDRNFFYTVTKYVRGGDLKTRMKNRASGRNYERENLVIFRQIAQGIFALHQRNIIHRDIKLENIMVDVDQTGVCNTYIGDFGSSEQLESKNDTRQFYIGTKGYLAPEMLLKKAYGLGIDIWSAGILLYILFTKNHPWQERDGSVSNKRVCREPLDMGSINHLMSDAAYNLITRMLKKNPSERLTIEQVLAHPWLQQQHAN